MKSLPKQILSWNTATLAVALALLLFSATALAHNSPPIADAGPDHTIYLGDSVTLHGTATDPDNDPILAWQWEVISAPTGRRTRWPTPTPLTRSSRPTRWATTSSR